VTRVHILGAAGYAGSEVVRLALRHPYLKLGALESASHAGRPIGEHAPALRTLARAFDAPGTAAASLAPGDAVVLAGDASFARAHAADFAARGARIVDLSDAFRLEDGARAAVYGLPERYRAAIAGAGLVANPGCYPTAALLALLPLVEFAADVLQFVVDAKSGVTGAGRTPVTAALFAEVDEDVRAYAFGGHRHQFEMEQELGAAGFDAPLTFTPHVVPLRRGLLADCYAFVRRPIDAAALHAAYVRSYAGNPFVRLLAGECAPSLPAVALTNDAEIHISQRGRVVRAVCAIDNLGRGAAGSALQNLNIMLGYPQECGLDDRRAKV
jgi:N-acetyl-gamma-glutamyl-phosphate reductase